MKTDFTVFFSWQTDIKGNTKIIKDELESQAIYLKEQYGYNVRIIDGTRDVPGMPPIEKVVMDRINDCDVYVCDITPVIEFEVSPAPQRKVKQMPNSSVMIELGFALRCLSYERIIAVARMGTWQDSELPFDISHMRVGKFSSSNCNLRFELEESIKHVAKHGKTRPYCDSLWGRVSQHIKMKIDRYEESKVLKKNVQDEILNVNGHGVFDTTSMYPKATDLSVVTVARRMAEAFPGVRGVKWFESKEDIKVALVTFFHSPLQYGNSNFGCGDPIWWYRAGSAEHCVKFRHLGGRMFLLNNERLKIRRIAVFRHSGMYYREYIYIETSPEKASGVNIMNPVSIKDNIELRGYMWEEYAEFRLLPFLKFLIKEDDYDDGHTKKFGKIWPTRNRSEMRVRYLSPYNILIAAKGSPYNSHEFDRDSGDWMNGLLQGTHSFDDFNQWLQNLPRNPLEDNI